MLHSKNKCIVLHFSFSDFSPGHRSSSWWKPKFSWTVWFLHQAIHSELRVSVLWMLHTLQLNQQTVQLSPSSLSTLFSFLALSPPCTQSSCSWGRSGHRWQLGGGGRGMARLWGAISSQAARVSPGQPQLHTHSYITSCCQINQSVMLTIVSRYSLPLMHTSTSFPLHVVLVWSGTGRLPCWPANSHSGSS